MTVLLDECLRQAMKSGAGEFSPCRPLGATRTTVVGRIRRRQRQTVSAGVAAMVVMAVVVLGLSLGRSGNSPSHRVAAVGAGRSPTTAPGDGSAAAVAAGAASATTPNPSDAASPPSSSAGPGGPVPGTAPPARTAPTSVPVGTTPTTAATHPTTSTSAVSGVRGVVVFSPVCPGPSRLPPDPNCAPKPGAAHVQLLRADGTTAAEGDAGANGVFVIDVAPGGYTVKAVSIQPTTAAVGRGCSADPTQVTVTQGSMSRVSVSCDTGMR